MSKGKVLLSFDVEEFDLPKEHGGEITLKQGIKISKSGLLKVLKILRKYDVKATFFCTANFVEAEPELIRNIAEAGHEIAGHGVDHFAPQKTDIEIAKKKIEKVLHRKIVGYRQPRMQTTRYAKMKKLGYVYDSSVNPTFIPGRYNHLNVPRKAHKKQDLVEIPTSVATVFRIPLFWLALHLFPEWLYLLLVKRSLKETGYLAIYFHPWEFFDLKQFSIVPKYIQHNSGKKLEKRLENLIVKLKEENFEFQTYATYAKM